MPVGIEERKPDISECSKAIIEAFCMDPFCRLCFKLYFLTSSDDGEDRAIDSYVMKILGLQQISGSVALHNVEHNIHSNWFYPMVPGNRYSVDYSSALEKSFLALDRAHFHAALVSACNFHLHH